jgi:DNA-binding CsgD family transcriptional regulator
MDLQTTIVLDRTDLAVAENVIPLCELAKGLEEAGEFAQAAETLRPFWVNLGERPVTAGLEPDAQAELLLRAGRVERGLELLTLTGSHPASDYQLKAKVQDLLKRYEVDDLVEIESGPVGDLQNVIEVIQNELAALGKDEGARSGIKDETKHIPHHHLPPAVHGGSSLTPAMPQGAGASGLHPFVEPLTSRELEILRLIADGLSNPEIAAALIITTGTVKAHTHHIYGKLNATNRVQAIARARESGLL